MSEPSKAVDGLETYWAAASDGKLAISRCKSCEKPYFYPRPLCPLCGSADTEWMTASGKGKIYSYSIIRNAKRPTAAAIVELAEGPRVTSALTDCDVFELKIGDEVEVAFQKSDKAPPALAFTIGAAEAARRYSRAALKNRLSCPGSRAMTRQRRSGRRPSSAPARWEPASRSRFCRQVFPSC